MYVLCLCAKVVSVPTNQPSEGRRSGYPNASSMLPSLFGDGCQYSNYRQQTLWSWELLSNFFPGIYHCVFGIHFPKRWSIIFFYTRVTERVPHLGLVSFAEMTTSRKPLPAEPPIIPITNDFESPHLIRHTPSGMRAICPEILCGSSLLCGMHSSVEPSTAPFNIVNQGRATEITAPL